jgi:hypothetical protein
LIGPIRVRKAGSTTAQKSTQVIVALASYT